MGIFSKKEKQNKPKSDKTAILTKAASPVLKAIYYVMLLFILLAGIVALIMLLVNTSVEEMMLPPFMALEGDTYSITIGNGIRVNCAYDSVSLKDIKTVIYAQLLMFACACAIIAPVSLFLSKLAKKISLGEHDEKSARYITYIGLCVMVGSTVLRIVDSFYNFLLVKTFVSDPESIRFAFGLPLGGIAAGVLIIVFAGIYAAVCAKYVPTKAVEVSEREE